MAFCVPPKTEGGTPEVFTDHLWETAPEWVSKTMFFDDPNAFKYGACRSRSQGNLLASKKPIVAGGSFALVWLIWQRAELTAEWSVNAELAEDPSR